MRRGPKVGLRNLRDDMHYIRYGGYNTKTKELSHIYDIPAQVEMCYPLGKDTPNLKIVELKINIIGEVK
jgi:hypothetical protein